MTFLGLVAKFARFAFQDLISIVTKNGVALVCAELGLPVRLAGANKYAKDVHSFLFTVRGKEEPIVTEPATEHSFPFLAMEGFYIALEWVRSCLGYQARDTF
jgi:hypothetical protein